MRTAGKLTDPDKTLTFEEARLRLQLNSSTLYSRINRGNLTPIKVAGRIFFNIAEIIAEEERVAFLQKKKTGPKPTIVPALPLTSSFEGTSQPQKNLPKPTLTSKPQTPSKTQQIVDTEGDQAGKTAAKAAKLFNDGKGVRDVVIELSITFALAKQIYEDYKSCGPELHLTPETITKLRKRLNWLENSPTPEGLISAIDEHVIFLTENKKKENVQFVQPSSPTPVSTPEGGKTIERVVPDNIADEVDFNE